MRLISGDLPQLKAHQRYAGIYERRTSQNRLCILGRKDIPTGRALTAVVKEEKCAPGPPTKPLPNFSRAITTLKIGSSTPMRAILAATSNRANRNVVGGNSAYVLVYAGSLPVLAITANSRLSYRLFS